MPPLGLDSPKGAKGVVPRNENVWASGEAEKEDVWEEGEIGMEGRLEPLQEQLSESFVGDTLESLRGLGVEAFSSKELERQVAYACFRLFFARVFASLKNATD